MRKTVHQLRVIQVAREVDSLNGLPKIKRSGRYSDPDYQLNYYWKNKIKRNENSKKWYAKIKEQREKNRERLKQYHKQYYLANKIRLQQYKRDYHIRKKYKL